MPTYRTNLRALSLAECTRMSGGTIKGLVTWLLTRFQDPAGSLRLPADYDELETDAAGLGDTLATGLGPHVAGFEKSGFRRVGYQRIRQSDDPDHVAAGSIILLSSDGCVVAPLNVTIRRSGETLETQAFCSAMMFSADGGCLSVTNSGMFLDPPPGSSVRSLRTDNPNVLVTAVRKLAQRRRFQPVSFSSWREIRAAMEGNDLRAFEHRRDVRKLFVPAAADASTTPS